MTRNRFSLVFLFLICFAAGAQAATASVYLSFDPDEQVSQATVPVAELFEFYLVVDVEDPNGLEAYEALVTLDAGILFSDIELMPASSTNLQQSFNAGVVDLFVVTGGCVPVAGATAVTKFRAMLLQETEELFINIGPRSPSSFGNAPGYLSCTDELVPFENWGSQSQLKVSSGPLASRPSSFGAVKALYRGGQS